MISMLLAELVAQTERKVNVGHLRDKIREQKPTVRLSH